MASINIGQLRGSRPRAALSSWRSMRAVAPQMVSPTISKNTSDPVVAVGEAPDLLVKGLGIQQVGQGHVEDVLDLTGVGHQVLRWTG